MLIFYFALFHFWRKKRSFQCLFFPSSLHFPLCHFPRESTFPLSCTILDTYEIHNAPLITLGLIYDAQSYYTPLCTETLSFLPFSFSDSPPRLRPLFHRFRRFCRDAPTTAHKRRRLPPTLLHFPLRLHPQIPHPHRW